MTCKVAVLQYYEVFPRILLVITAADPVEPADQLQNTRLLSQLILCLKAGKISNRRNDVNPFLKYSCYLSSLMFAIECVIRCNFFCHCN